MKIFSEKKAQASIEILLLVAGIIIIAVIAGLALKGAGSNAANNAANQINQTGGNIK